MPTNEQRRANAKRKLERQLERRAKQAKTRRIVLIAAASIVAVAVIAAVVITVVNTKHDHKSNTAASTTTSAQHLAGDHDSPGRRRQAAPLPPFKPSANVGANCQYPASPEPAAKQVKPPRTGKVPTDPAQVSASMVTNQGNIGLMLANNESPCTVNSFASLIGQKYFDNTKCHRLTTSQGLGVLQCGDPKGDGTGGPGYQFANEYPTDQYPPNDPKAQEPVALSARHAGHGQRGARHQRQPILHGLQGLPATAAIHRVRHHPARRAGDPGQDRQGRRRRRR